MASRGPKAGHRGCTRAPEGEAQGDDRCSYQRGLYECRYLLIYEEFLYHLGGTCEIHSVLWNFNYPLGHVQ